MCTVKLSSMEKEFIPYELAVKLKAIGFNEPCMFVHDTWGNTKNWTEDGEGEHRNSHINASIYYSAPLFQQVFRWFREKYQASPTIHCMSEQGNSWRYYIPNEGGEKDFLTYEEAELACLEKLIELVEQKEK